MHHGIGLVLLSIYHRWAQRRTVMQELRAAVKSSRSSIRQRARTAGRMPHEAEARIVSLLMSSKEEQMRWNGAGWNLTDLEGTDVLPIAVHMEISAGRLGAAVVISLMMVAIAMTVLISFRLLVGRSLVPKLN